MIKDVREEIYEIGVKVDVIENDIFINKSQVIDCIDKILNKYNFVGRHYNQSEVINKLLEIEKLEGDGSRLSLVANWLIYKIKANKVDVLFWHEIIDSMLYSKKQGNKITDVELENFLEIISIYRDNLT